MVLSTTVAQSGVLSESVFAKQKMKVARKDMKGIIDKLVPADAANNVKASLIVLDADKKALTFLLSDALMINDTDLNPVPLDKLVSGVKVKVQYSVFPSGEIIAYSILILNK